MKPEGPAHYNPKTPPLAAPSARAPRRPRSSPCLAAVFTALAAALLGGLAAGCGPVHLGDLKSRDDILVRLDANARAHLPGRRIKFFVDLVNQTETTVDIRGIRVELLASPEASPETVSLRHLWRYRWDLAATAGAQRAHSTSAVPRIAPGKRFTIPVVPERGVEFPLEILHPGDYRIVAIVNERFVSSPYSLKLARPDLLSRPAASEEARDESTAPAGYGRR